jgi:carboxyl-terminal processing protease
MIKLISALLLLIISLQTFGQNQKKEISNIATFTKIWGFLKYYHPAVASGKTDWDKEFTSRSNGITALHSKDEISNYYLQWIKSLGNIEVCKKCNNNNADSLKYNLADKWMADTTVFTSALIQQLKYIEVNRNQGKNFYVDHAKYVGNTTFENEKEYKDSLYPSAVMRLLGLARYWNIINYFYPYKYKLDEDWDSVLYDMIPLFKDAEDTINYNLALMQLTAKLDDSHAGFLTKYTNQFFGSMWAPFRFKLIDGKAIVTDYFNDSLCKKNNIRKGDVFLSVNNVSIEKIIDAKKKYIGASNEPTRFRNYSYAVFNGNTDSVLVKFERGGVIADKTLHRYYFKDFNYKPLSIADDVSKIIDNTIGYVNMGLLMPKQVDDVLANLKNTAAIIFDVRNYPNGTLYQIADFLNKQKVPFAKFTIPDLSYPGVFTKSAYTYSCGKKNNDYYKGKVILLFNETSQSHAEFTLMALKTAPNVIGIGSQTAGADGNVSVITFPGGYKTWMTGIGVYYPDGGETQRIGIVPDIVVTPTIDGIKNGKDEVLEKALEVARRK